MKFSAICVSALSLTEGKVALTDDLLVRAIFPSTDVNEIKHSLCSSEAPHKVFKVFDRCQCACPHQCVTKTSDIGVNSTNDTGGEGDIFGFVLDPIAHGGVKLGCCAATSGSSITNVLVVELRSLVPCGRDGKSDSYDHTIAVDQHHNKRVLRLQRSATSPYSL